LVRTRSLCAPMCLLFSLPTSNFKNLLAGCNTNQLPTVFKLSFIVHTFFVKSIQHKPALCLALIELIGVDNFIYKSTTDCLKIQTTNPDAYRALVHFLRDEKAEFHTYQFKKDKPLWIVIRNLHPTTPLNLI